MPVQPLLGTDPGSIGEFTLRCRLGEGAYGVVYEASHGRLGRVALKVLRPALAVIPQVRARLRSEAQALQRVRGNCTASVLEVNADGAVAYLALEFVEGLNLFEYVSAHGPVKGPLLDVLRDGLVEALASVHAANIVHRDLKPTNIMFGPGGVHVLDFGISVLLEVAANTGTDIALGTETWMSPEQAQGGNLGAASDVFNLGMVLAYAATGVHPFGGGRAAALMYRVVHEQANLGGVPAGLRGLVERCLEKDPLARPDLRLARPVSGDDPEKTVVLIEETLREDGRSSRSELGGGGHQAKSQFPKSAAVLLAVPALVLVLYAIGTLATAGAARTNGGARVTAHVDFLPLATTAPTSTKEAAPPETAVPTAIPAVACVQAGTKDLNGGKYTGDLCNGLAHGQGTLTFSDGATYTGSWLNDKEDGQGTLTLPDGETYSGAFRDDLFNGQGILTLPNGDKYNGAFKDNKRDGQGTMTLGDGTTYNGAWQDDKYNGEGTLTLPNGDKYNGAFKDNKRDGQGTMTLGDIRTYNGAWQDDKYNGEGTLTVPHATYSGAFRDGKRSGQGTEIVHWGATYIGNWLDDERNGRGTETMPNGAKYTGEWQDGMRTVGTLIWSNGDRYTGAWKDSEMHGQGSYTWSNGGNYTGNWVYGKRTGQGTFTTPTGAKYTGSWLNGQENGQGTLRFADGIIYNGNWVGGKYNGQGTLTSPAGDKYIGEFKDGILNGQGSWTFANGDNYTGEFKEDRRNGQGTLTYADGTVDTGIWKDGKLVRRN